MNLVIGSDHAGYALKAILLPYLLDQGHEVIDMGTYSEESADYPDYAHAVAGKVETGQAEYGILLCGSANGVAITANKHEKIRAAIAWMPELAELARRHNDANILCLPARYINEADAKRCCDLFLKTEFEGGRHDRRVAKIPC
jgi:ribose 5-phosphate isomerase B